VFNARFHKHETALQHESSSYISCEMAQVMARPKLSSSSRRAIARLCHAGRETTPATVAIHLSATLLQVLCEVAVRRTRYMRSALIAREPLNFDRHMMEMSCRKFQRLYRLRKVDFITLSRLLRPNDSSRVPGGATQR
jgi:hypothetical protein